MPAPRPPEPETVADVHPDGVYRLAVAARLLGVHPATFRAHADPAGLLKPTPASWTRVKGSEILRQFGQREVDRAARCGERGETEGERAGRAAEAVARLARLAPTKRPRAKAR